MLMHCEQPNTCASQQIQTTPTGRLVSFGALIDRYMAEEMPQRFSTQAAYRTYLGRYIKPKWAQYSISTVKPFAVRAWLKDLPLAPKSQAHIRNLMSVLFNCAMLWDLIEVQVNPMKLVKIPGSTKRQEGNLVFLPSRSSTSSSRRSKESPTERWSCLPCASVYAAAS